jgi:hypothetical protein
MPATAIVAKSHAGAMLPPRAMAKGARFIIDLDLANAEAEVLNGQGKARKNAESNQDCC